MHSVASKVFLGYFKIQTPPLLLSSLLTVQRTVQKDLFQKRNTKPSKWRSETRPLSSDQEKEKKKKKKLVPTAKIVFNIGDDQQPIVFLLDCLHLYKERILGPER